MLRGLWWSPKQWYWSLSLVSIDGENFWGEITLSNPARSRLVFLSLHLQSDRWPAGLKKSLVIDVCNENINVVWNGVTTLCSMELVQSAEDLLWSAVGISLVSQLGCESSSTLAWCRVAFLLLAFEAAHPPLVSSALNSEVQTCQCLCLAWVILMKGVCKKAKRSWLYSLFYDSVYFYILYIKAKGKKAEIKRTRKSSGLLNKILSFFPLLLGWSVWVQK